MAASLRRPQLLTAHISRPAPRPASAGGTPPPSRAILYGGGTLGPKKWSHIFQRRSPPNTKPKNTPISTPAATPSQRGPPLFRAENAPSSANAGTDSSRHASRRGQ